MLPMLRWRWYFSLEIFYGKHENVRRIHMRSSNENVCAGARATFGALWKIYWLWLHRMHHLRSCIKHGVDLDANEFDEIITYADINLQTKVNIFQFITMAKLANETRGMGWYWVMRAEHRCLPISEINGITIRILSIDSSCFALLLLLFINHATWNCCVYFENEM